NERTPAFDISALMGPPENWLPPSEKMRLILETPAGARSDGVETKETEPSRLCGCLLRRRRFQLILLRACVTFLPDRSLPLDRQEHPAPDLVDHATAKERLMPYHHRFSRSKSVSTRIRKPASLSRGKPTLEALEDRTLLSVWTPVGP